MLRDTKMSAGGGTSDVYVDPVTGDVYFNDPIRSKTLGVALIQYDVGRNHPNVTNQYLRGVGDSPTNQNGFVLPWNATLVIMTMSGKLDSQNWAIEIRKNEGGVAQASLNISNSKSNFNNDINVDFNAGDRVMIYCDGVSVNFPHASLFFRRRL